MMTTSLGGAAGRPGAKALLRAGAAAIALLGAAGLAMQIKASEAQNGVNWFVMTEPIQASAEQMRMFSDIVGDNARPQQAAHNRLFVTSS